MNLGLELYHIDKPNAQYEVIKVNKMRKSDSQEDYFYAYAAYFHPSFADIKTLRKYDIGRTFFLTREEMLNARIDRAKRLLELEISAKERKL